jgi:hypothetical protein
MSCDPAYYPLKIRREITFGPLTVTCQDVNAVPVDLTGFLVFALARPELESTTNIDLGPVITDPVNGVITIAFTDEQTAAFALGEYVYDIVLEDGSGNRLNPILAGPLSIIDVVSRE